MRKKGGKEKRKREVVFTDPPAEDITSTDDDALVNIKPLPIEVLKNILDRLTDRHTLAQCMRVSPTFNAIVAPSLYRSVNIDGKTRMFFASPRMSDELRQNRKTQTKADNVDYVEEVTYAPHKKRGCTPASNMKRWDPLALNTRVLSTVTPCPENQVEFDINNVHCDCLSYISFQKLVWTGKMHDWTAENMKIPNQLDTTAVITSSDPLVRGRGTYLSRYYIPWFGNRLSPNSNRSVFLIYSAPTASTSGDFGYYDWQRLSRCIFDLARRNTSPINFVFVNIESLVSQRLPATERKNMSLTEAAGQATKREYLTGWRPSAYHSGARSLEQARQVSFKFVTMKTYLSEHDWRGELTEEQARPWLE
jgi:hypothetical protein